jgi:hypothetical protein
MRPFTIPVAVGGRLNTTQCVYVPPGASGSSTTNATLTAPAGSPLQVSGGAVLLPLQVNLAGIGVPAVKAGLRTMIVTGAADAAVGVTEVTAARAGDRDAPPGPSAFPPHAAKNRLVSTAATAAATRLQPAPPRYAFNSRRMEDLPATWFALRPRQVPPPATGAHPLGIIAHFRRRPSARHTAEGTWAWILPWRRWRVRCAQSSVPGRWAAWRDAGRSSSWRAARGAIATMLRA